LGLTIGYGCGRILGKSEELGDIFLKNLFLKCFWWALRNKEFDFLIFKEGGYKVFSPLSLRKRFN